MELESHVLRLGQTLVEAAHAAPDLETWQGTMFGVIAQVGFEVAFLKAVPPHCAFVARGFDAEILARLRVRWPTYVLVSNAGRLVFGPSEEVPLAEAQQMFETNFWGGVRVVNAVLPGMRARKRGLVILVGSTAAWVALPLNAFYSASKAALSRYAEALRHETMHLGVRVSLVEPSEIATAFWERASKAPSRFPDYTPIRGPVFAALPSLFARAPHPNRLAALIEEVARVADPKPVYRFGGLARRMPWMRVILPGRSFERGLRRQFGLGINQQT